MVVADLKAQGRPKGGSDGEVRAERQDLMWRPQGRRRSMLECNSDHDSRERATIGVWTLSCTVRSSMKDSGGILAPSRAQSPLLNPPVEFQASRQLLSIPVSRTPELPVPAGAETWEVEVGWLRGAQAGITSQPERGSSSSRFYIRGWEIPFVLPSAH